MKVRSKPRVTLDVELLAEVAADNAGVDGKPAVVAVLAHVTRKHNHDIQVAALKRTWDKVNNTMSSELDQFEILKERLRVGFVGIRGLTIDRLLELAELPDGAELDVPELVDGFIPWDHDHIVFGENIVVDDPTEKEPTRKRTITRAHTLPTYLYTYGDDVVQDTFEKVQKHWSEAVAAHEKKSMKTSNN